MSSLFLTRVGEYVSVSACICTHTRTHTHCTCDTRCEPRGRDETVAPGGPEETRWTKCRHIRIRIGVQSTQFLLERACAAQAK